MIQGAIVREEVDSYEDEGAVRPLCSTRMREGQSDKSLFTPNEKVLIVTRSDMGVIRNHWKAMLLGVRHPVVNTPDEASNLRKYGSKGPIVYGSTPAAKPGNIGEPSGAVTTYRAPYCDPRSPVSILEGSYI